MNLYETLKSEIKTAMKSGDKEKLGTLRVLVGEIERKEKAPSDDFVVSRIKFMVDASRDNYSKYPEDKYLKEIDILSVYLPKVLSEAETKTAVDSVIVLIGASKSNLGRIMGELKKNHGSSIDMKIAKAYLDTILS